MNSPSAEALSLFEAVSLAITMRRTNLRVDLARHVDDDLVLRLLELATWAPNHKRTEPWRFALLRGDARRRLGELTAEHLELQGEEAAKVAKTRTKYERSPVVLVVASESEPGAGSTRCAEDRDATAAAIQNLLLGATGAGLASYWGTGPITEVRSVKEFCGFRPDATIVGVVYLGWPIGTVPVPERRAPIVTSRE